MLEPSGLWPQKKADKDAWDPERQFLIRESNYKLMEGGLGEVAFMGLEKDAKNKWTKPMQKSEEHLIKP